MSDATRTSELINMTVLGRAMGKADQALFATRHDTPQGQVGLQDLHDLAARLGAVCNRANANMASRHEADAIQAIHDQSVDHGATCSSTANRAVYAKPELGAAFKHELEELVDRLASGKVDEAGFVVAFARAEVAESRRRVAEEQRLLEEQRANRAAADGAHTARLAALTPLGRALMEKSA